MAHLPYPDPASLPDAERRALARLPPLNIFRMLAHAPGALRPYLRFGGALLSELELDPALRELAILQTARSAEAEYEWIQHVTMAEAVGVSRAQIAALEAGQLDDASLGLREQAVVRFTAEVVRTPRPAPEHLASLREHLSEQEVVELLLVIGAYTMLGRVMTVLDVDLDDSLGADVLQSAQRRWGT